MTTQLLFANNASSTLAQSITGSTVAIALAPGTGALFPVPASGQAFMATLTDTLRTKFEVVKVTGVIGDTLTVARGKEGTAPLSWAAGDLIANSATAGTLATLQAGNGATNAASTLTASFTQPAVGSNVSALMANTAWLAPGGYVYVVGGGVYTVQGVPGGVTAVLTNTGAVGNASPGATVPSTSAVVASGPTGPKGDPGTNGTNGTNGAPGAAATVTVGTTTTLPAGSPATVTNVGTTSAAVFNFGVPKGANGAGTGTVTSASVVSANGFAGTVATASTTPAITLTTTVTTGKILKAGSSGEMVAATAGTDYASATPGTASQLLASDGAGGFAAVNVSTGLTLSGDNLTATGGGAWTKISTLTASYIATLDWTGLSGYSRYAIKLEKIVPSTSGPLGLRVGTGSPPTWLTSGYVNQYLAAIKMDVSLNSNNLASYWTAGAAVFVGRPTGISGWLWIDSMQTSSPMLTGDTTTASASAIERDMVGGLIAAEDTPTALRLQMYNQNLMTSGTATLYGIN